MYGKCECKWQFMNIQYWMQVGYALDAAGFFISFHTATLPGNLLARHIINHQFHWILVPKFVSHHSYGTLHRQKSLGESESCRETFFDFFNPEFHHQKGSPKKLLRAGIMFDSLYRFIHSTMGFRFFQIYIHVVDSFKHDTSSYALRCCASTWSHLKSNNVWKHDPGIPSCTNRNKQSPQIVLFHVS